MNYCNRRQSDNHPKNLPNYIMLRPKATGSIHPKAYVLSIVALPHSYAAAASSPADTIQLYAKTDLRHLTTLEGHPGGTTSIRSVNLHAISNTSGPMLSSCGKDGYIRIWDLRSNSPSIESAFPKHAHTRLFFFFLLSFTFSPLPLVHLSRLTNSN